MEWEANDNQLIEDEQLTEVTEDKEMTGVCGSRRHISDLETCDPTTGFPTKWMSDLSGYDSQVTIVDNKGNYTAHLEIGNMCTINIIEDSAILCDWLLAEGRELNVTENIIAQRNALVENKNQLEVEEYGLEY